MSIDISTAMIMYCEAILTPHLSPLDPARYNEALARLNAAYRERFGLTDAEAQEMIVKVCRKWVNAYYDSDGAR